jgi:hypothetical protein
MEKAWIKLSTCISVGNSAIVLGVCIRLLEGIADYFGSQSFGLQ